MSDQSAALAAAEASLERLKAELAAMPLPERKRAIAQCRAALDRVVKRDREKLRTTWTKPGSAPFVETVVKRTLEFLPGVEVPAKQAVAKMWAKAALAALRNGRWRPVLRALRVIKSEASDLASTATSERITGWDLADLAIGRDRAAVVAYKEAWAVDGAFTMKLLTTADLVCRRTVAGKFLAIVEPVRPAIRPPQALRREIVEPAIKRVVAALEHVHPELLLFPSHGSSPYSSDEAAPILIMWICSLENIPTRIMHGSRMMLSFPVFPELHAFARAIECWANSALAGYVVCIQELHVAIPPQCAQMMNKPLIRPIDEEKGRELTRDWVDRKKAAQFVAEYAHAGADIKKRNDEVQASLAAGEITMHSLMTDTAKLAEGSL